MDLRSTLLLRDDESVIAVYRHHPFRYLTATLLAGLFLIAPFFFLAAAATWQQVGLIIILIALAVGLILTFRLFRLWFYSMLVVTDQRIIDVDQQTFFNCIVSEIPLARARYTTYGTDGVIGTILNYGTVSIEGEGSSVCIAYDTVYKPAAVHRLVTDLVAERHGIGSSGGTVTAPGSRVNDLIAAAAELDPTQARAFMLALDQAFRKGKHADELVSSKSTVKQKKKRPSKPVERSDDVDLEQFAPEKE